MTGEDGIHFIGAVSDYSWNLPSVKAIRMHPSESFMEIIFNRILIDEVVEWADANVSGQISYGRSINDGASMIFENASDAMMCWLRWS